MRKPGPHSTNNTGKEQTMAYQGYRSKDDTTVGRASVLPVKNGGENLTPPPVKSAGELEAKRAAAWGGADTLAPGADNPGRNRYAGPVSLPPGVKADAPAFSAMAPTDLVLDALVNGGAKAAAQSDPWQLRDIDSTQGVATHPGMSKRGAADGSPGGVVPAKVGGAVDEIAMRAAALARAAGSQ